MEENKMVTVEIKKDLKNVYQKQEELGLKKLSAEVFKSLEEIMTQYEDLTIIKHDYTDIRSFWSDYTVTGELLYRDYRGKKEISLDEACYGELRVKFFSGFQREVGEECYHRIKLKAWGDREKITKAVEELTTKFKSFEEK